MTVTDRDAGIAVLGAGVTGIAVGGASGARVYERSDRVGGICASYYVPRPTSILQVREECYRFEVGGGHWIWGGDEDVMRLLSSFAALRCHERRSFVYLPDRDLLVPYPLQYHLRSLDRAEGIAALNEIERARSAPAAARTLADSLPATFGETLARIFFTPFHDLYTAGQCEEIAAEADGKSPIDPRLVVQGLTDIVAPVGYNTSFWYPTNGLDTVVAGLADGVEIAYGCDATRVDLSARIVEFADGRSVPYRALASTIPLNILVKLAGLDVGVSADPYTSVLVINIGALRGKTQPDAHWVYVPSSEAGFHRVGYYSNVDQEFLPASVRGKDTHASVYVEKSFPGGERPTREATSKIVSTALRELRAWGWIGEPEVVDLTWIEVAYTWRRPGSTWRERAIAALERENVFPVGRFGRWVTEVSGQGIAQSVRDGLTIGRALLG